MTAVTAFIPIPDHPRSADEYRRLAVPLLSINRTHPILTAEGKVDDCWLYKYLLGQYDMDTSKFSYSIADNPKKNSLWYHIVQAEKTMILAGAAKVDIFAKVFVWIDYGIFHIPGVTMRIIEEFLDRAENEQAIAIPGCWDKPYDYNDEWPCWRFCGGVMIVPRHYVDVFNMAVQQEYIRWLKQTGNISWEVNVLARLEEEAPDIPIWWYKADHDKTIFTNYISTERADSGSLERRRVTHV